MGYDVEFIELPAGEDAVFPIAAAAADKLLQKRVPLADPAEVRRILLAMDGARPGPGGAIDYIGQGLSYGRFTVHEDRIHVENNLNGHELLKVHGLLSARWPGLRIHDLQSGQVHDADSFRKWWSGPL